MSSPGTDQELNIIKYSDMISSMISSLSAFSVLIVYFKLTNLHKNSIIKSIFYLNLANFFNSLANSLGPFFVSNPQLCSVFGSISVYSSYSSNLWLTIIAHVFYNMVKQQSDKIIVGQNTHVKYLLVGFALPVIVTAIGIHYGWFGSYWGITCTINTEEDASQLFTAYVYGIYLPTSLTFVVMSGFYLKSLMYLRSFADPSLARKICYETVLYPIVFFLGYIFLVVSSLVNNMEGNDIFWLELVALILRRLQGFFDAVIYGYNPQVRSEVAKHVVRRVETKSQGSLLMQISDSMGSSEVSPTSSNKEVSC